jgi:hypothetical protein
MSPVPGLSDPGIGGSRIGSGIEELRGRLWGMRSFFRFKPVDELSFLAY